VAVGRLACGDCRGGKDGLGERLRHGSTPRRARAAEEEAGEGGAAVWAAKEEAVAGRRRRLCSRGRSGWRRKQRWGRHRMEIRWS